MARSRERKPRGAQGPQFVHNPEFYAVDPEKDFPQEWVCMNVMCRAHFMRAFGETEFCPACRKCLPAGRVR